MPHRVLKPGIVTSVRYNRLTWQAQCLHDRLVTVVDDFARYDAEPIVLARVLFPFGDHTGRPISLEEAEAWLQELVQQDVVSVYTSHGKRCLQLKRWTERCRAANSRFPAPPQLEFGLGCNRQQSPAIASNRQQSPANDGLPSRPVHVPSRPDQGNNNKGEVPAGNSGPNGASVVASKVQWSALKGQVKALEQRGSELSEEERQILRKKRRELRELEERQASARF